MSFSDYPAIEFKDLASAYKPGEPRDAIEVPIAHYAEARGPVGKRQGIRILFASTFHNVALALVSEDKNGGAPLVVFGNLDDHAIDARRGDPAHPTRTQILINRIPKACLQTTRAYVVEGLYKPALLECVLEDLRDNKIPFALRAEDRFPSREKNSILSREKNSMLGYISTLAIDLTDGRPVDPGCLSEVVHYKPEPYLVRRQGLFRSGARRIRHCQNENDLHLFADAGALQKALDGRIRKPNAPPPDDVYAPLAKAFDLRQGVPEGYRRIEPQPDPEQNAAPAPVGPEQKPPTRGNSRDLNP